MAESTFNILVTGANAGIGFALCKTLAAKRHRVFLCARNAERGEAAVKEILAEVPGGKVDFVLCDVTSDESVKAAAAAVKEKLGDEKLYAIVNNAGTGLGHPNITEESVLQTNLYGPKRIVEAFGPLWQRIGGRIVNVGAGSGPGYVKNHPQHEKVLCSWDTTWEQVEELIKLKDWDPERLAISVVGFSKAALMCYTRILSKQFPSAMVTQMSPGFVATAMTKSWGAKAPIEDAMPPFMFALFGAPAASGLYYGSDLKRSPLHFLRDPGSDEYKGDAWYDTASSPAILVTGANAGLGFLVCKTLAAKRHRVFLCARNAERGEAAVKEILAEVPGGKVDFVLCDVTSDESVKAAAAAVKEKLGDEKLYAIVNNAGTGLGHPNITEESVLQTNLYGPKRIVEAFGPLWMHKGGRIVNIGAGSGPGYVKNHPQHEKVLCSWDTTWEQVEELIKLKDWDPERLAISVVGFTKASLMAYTRMLSRQYPDAMITQVTPGFVATAMTKSWGAKDPIEAGLPPYMFALFGAPAGSGMFYGSDLKRSPLHFLRDPGSDEYKGDAWYDSASSPSSITGSLSKMYGTTVDVITGAVSPVNKVVSPMADQVAGAVSGAIGSARAVFSSHAKTPKDIELGYFNIQAAPGEQIRLALKLNGIKFKDTRINFPDWPALKGTMKYGTLPYLKADGQTYYQSGSLIRWVGQMGDGSLYPNNDPIMCRKIEEMIGLADDLSRGWFPLVNMEIGMHMKFGHPQEWKDKDEVNKRLRGSFHEQEFTQIMTYLTNELTQTGAFLCGPKPTIADCRLVPFIDYFAQGVPNDIPKDCAKPYPLVLAWIERFKALPALKEHYKPATE